MKSLYININNEQIQSNAELEVLKHDLDSDFFFYLGEKIAKGCNVENENALITNFNTQDTEEDYKQIIAQWNELKSILFSEECEGKFELTLPNGYIHWLRYSEKYNSLYDRIFSHGEPTTITIDLEELYEDSVGDLQRKILRKLQRGDLYLEIDEIVFNDDSVTRKSPIVRAIKAEYKNIGFVPYKKWAQENMQIKIGLPNRKEDELDELTLLVNWLCDKFEVEKGVNWRKDDVKMKEIYSIVKSALNQLDNFFFRAVTIYIPYVANYDLNGKPIHTTNFEIKISKELLDSLKHPNAQDSSIVHCQNELKNNSFSATSSDKIGNISTKTKGINLFFPIYGVILGQTSLAEFKLYNSENMAFNIMIDKWDNGRLYWEDKGLTFYIQKKILLGLYLRIIKQDFPQKQYNIITQWEKSGINWNMTYNECFDFFQSINFIIMSVLEPRCCQISNMHDPFYNASVIACSLDKTLYCVFDFQTYDVSSFSNPELYGIYFTASEEDILKIKKERIKYKYF